MTEQITLFGVECPLSNEWRCEPGRKIWHGQMKNYPSLDVYIQQFHANKGLPGHWHIRIEWFGGFNRLYLTGSGPSYDAAVEKVRNEFRALLKGAEALKEEILEK